MEMGSSTNSVILLTDTVTAFITAFFLIEDFKIFGADTSNTTTTATTIDNLKDFGEN